MFSSIPRRTIPLVVPLLLAGLAACGRSSTGSSVLDPTEIAGDYRVCTLIFAPDGGIPDTVNILARMDTTVSTPRLEIGGTPQRQYSLLYRLADGGTTQSLSGTYATGPRDVQLVLGTQPQVRRLLLPERLSLEYSEERVLSHMEVAGSYIVARSDYEALKGQSFPALRDEFPGRLSARFVRWGTACS